jgi:hypothetical protein
MSTKTDAAGAIDITMSVPGKEVDINVANYGDRPTTSFSATANEAPHLSGTARLGSYTVTVDWPTSASAPKIVINP